MVSNMTFDMLLHLRVNNPAAAVQQEQSQFFKVGSSLRVQDLERSPRFLESSVMLAMPSVDASWSQITALRPRETESCADLAPTVLDSPTLSARCGDP